MDAASRFLSCSRSLLRMFRKIELSTGVFLLVMPFWTSQKWFPLLLQLRIDVIHRLPQFPDDFVDLLMGQPLLVDNDSYEEFSVAPRHRHF